MTSLGTATATDRRRGRGRGFSIHEDIRNPLSLLSLNVNRTRVHGNKNEDGGSHITEESKRAISTLINNHERTKSELEDKNISQEKIMGEVEELRAEVLRLQSTIKEDQIALQELNSIMEMEVKVKVPPAVIDSQEGLLEKLIAEENIIDRELFLVRDDKVIARAELWFGMMGKVDESIEHPDQASRDGNFAMRKERYIQTKRSVARETKVKLLLAKEEINKQKLEISQDQHVQGYGEFQEASPISESSSEETTVQRNHSQYSEVSLSSGPSDAGTIVRYRPDDYLDDSSPQSDQQDEGASWLTDHTASSSNSRGILLRSNNSLSETISPALSEENKLLKAQLQTTQESVQRWEEKFDQYRKNTTAAIKRLQTEVEDSQEIAQQVKYQLHKSEDLGEKFLKEIGALREEKKRLLVIVNEIGLPILARGVEYMKQIKRHGKHVDLDNHTTPFSKLVVRTGNIASTGGHINSHFASLLLCDQDVISGPVISHEMFLTIFGVSVEDYEDFYDVSDKLDEMLNMHACLVECGSFTNETLSKTRDELFGNLFDQCLLLFNGIEALCVSDKGRIFDEAVKDGEVEAFEEMVRIVKEIEGLQKLAL